MNKKIAVFGSINTDLTFDCDKLPIPGETVHGNAFQIAFGGKGANEAVACSRLGANVCLFGKIGDDYFSNKNLSNLKKENINLKNVEIQKNSFGGIAGICVDKQTNSIIITPGANDLVDTNYLYKVKKDLLKNDIFCLQLEIPFDTVCDVINLLHQNNKTIIFNPSPVRPIPNALLDKCSYIIVNEIEIKNLSGYQDDEQMLKKYGGKLILTKGDEGVYYFDDNKIKKEPALKVKDVVDTTGAGDTFLGAFACGLSYNLTFAQSIKFANIAGGLKIQKKGAQAGMPLLKDVKSLCDFDIE